CPVGPSLFGRLALERAVELLADRVLVAGQAIHDQAALAAERLEERIDNLTRVLGGEAVLLRRAEVRDARRLRRVPALAVVDAPGADDDDRRPPAPPAVRPFDDSPPVGRAPPGAPGQVR